MEKRHFIRDGINAVCIFFSDSMLVCLFDGWYAFIYSLYISTQLFTYLTVIDVSKSSCGFFVCISIVTCQNVPKKSVLNGYSSFCLQMLILPKPQGSLSKPEDEIQSSCCCTGQGKYLLQTRWRQISTARITYRQFPGFKISTSGQDYLVLKQQGEGRKSSGNNYLSQPSWHLGPQCA